MQCRARIRRPHIRSVAPVLVAAGLVCGTGTVRADTVAQGVPADVAYRIGDAFGVRVPTRVPDGGDGGDSRAGAPDPAAGGVGLLGDYYPGPAGLRLSGGVFVSDLDVDSRARGDVPVGNGAYSGVDLHVDATAKNTVMPALAVGYDAAIGQGWSLSADVVALYTGGFDVAVRDRTGQVSRADIAAETREREQDAPVFYPYLKFTVAFRF